MKTFGEKLRELRTAAGLTQTELAEKAGLHRQAIAKLELGERQPAWETVRSITKALGVSCEAFEGEPAVNPPRKPRKKR